MKKIIVILGLFLCLTGCGKESKEYDLVSLGSKLEPYFPNTSEVTKEELETRYDVDADNIKKAYIRMSSTSNQADLFFMIKPVDGKKTEVKEDLDTLLESFLTQYEMYYVEEAEKIKERKYMEKDGYLIYIVSEKQDLIVELLEKESK